MCVRRAPRTHYLDQLSRLRRGLGLEVHREPPFVVRIRQQRAGDLTRALKHLQVRAHLRFVVGWKSERSSRDARRRGIIRTLETCDSTTHHREEPAPLVAPGDTEPPLDRRRAGHHETGAELAPLQIEREFGVAPRDRLLHHERVAPECLRSHAERCPLPLDHLRPERLSEVIERLRQRIARPRLIRLRPEHRQYAVAVHRTQPALHREMHQQCDPLGLREHLPDRPSQAVPQVDHTHCGQSEHRIPGVNGALSAQ